MKVKDLIKRLEQYDSELEVVFYGLQDYNLEEKELESIQEADSRLEITIENRWSDMGWRGCLY